MKEQIKIDIVSDVVCPWCTIGYKRLEKAISEMSIQDLVEIEWHPFELNPQMPPEGQNIDEHLSEKYGSTLEQQKKSKDLLTTLGAELGFTFDYHDKLKVVNTLDAHILMDYAKAFGKQTELAMRLATAFYSESKDVSDRVILKQALQEVGLNADEALARLDNDEARYDIKSNASYWQSLGVNSVPTIIFNKKSGVTGAQPVEVYKEVLTSFLAK